jgi:hypothetical protein
MRKLTEKEQQQRDKLQERLKDRPIPPDAWQDVGVPMLDERDICKKCGEPINDEMGHMCP